MKWTNRLKPAELYTHTHTHTGKSLNGQKQIGTICFSKFFRIFIAPIFAIFCGLFCNIETARAGDCATNGSINSGYTRLEYIQGTGTQYINTGVVPTLNTGVYLRVALTYSQHENTFFGATDSSGFAGGQPFAIDVVDSYSTYMPHGGVGTSSHSSNIISKTININQIYEYKINYLNNGKAFIDTNEVTLGNSTTMTTKPLYIFYLNNINNGYKTPIQAKMYRVKLTENNNISHDYIPVKRDSDNVLGMCDTVNGEFLTNAGTGTFTAGPVVSTNLTVTYACGDGSGNGPTDSNTYVTGDSVTTLSNTCTPPSGTQFDGWLCGSTNVNAGSWFAITANTTCTAQYIMPCATNGSINSGFTHLEYIQSSGTQYIDTGTNVRFGDEFYFDYMKTSYISAEDKGYGVMSVEICGGGRRKNGYVTMWINNNYSYSIPQNDALQKRYVENWVISSGKLTSTLTEVGTSNVYNLTASNSGLSSSLSTSDMFLFKGAGGEVSPSAMRLYLTWLKRSNGDYAFYLIPAKRDSDGVIGMCDTVTGEFLTNAGTGTFTAGPAVSSNLSVTYACGDGSGNGPTDSNTYATGDSVTTLSNTCTAPSGGTFAGWLCGSTNVNAGSTFTISGNTTCTAQYIMPCATNGSINSGYTQLEYIESSGTQYIDTAVYFDTSKNFRIVGDVINPSTSYRKVIAGNWNGDSSIQYTIEFGSSSISKPGYFRNYFSNSSSTTDKWSNSALPANTLINYDSAYTSSSRTIANSLTYNGSTTSYSFSVVSINGTASRPLRLFLDYRGSNSAIAYPLSIGRTKMYKADTLVADFIPARRSSDSVLGMCDTVTGEFYTNAGTGTFTAGPAVSSNLSVTYSCGMGSGTAPSDSNTYATGATVTTLSNTCTAPSGYWFDKWSCDGTNVSAGSTFAISGDTTCTAQYIMPCATNGNINSGYTQLEYIESSGTQYINTGVTSSGIGIKSEVKLQLTSSSTSEAAIIGRNGGGGYEVYFSGGNTIGTYRYSGQGVVSTINYSSGDSFTIISEMTSNSITQSVNGVQSSYSGSMNSMDAYEMSLFRHNFKYPIYAKAYYVKLWNNGTLVRNFIPVRRDGDSVLGMCDTVNGVFYTNAGTGTFTAGPAVSSNLSVTYSCGMGSGTAPSGTTATYNASFTPASNTCTVPTGYSGFTGWLVSGTSDVKPAGTAFTWNYPEDKTLTAQYTGNTISLTWDNASGTPASCTYGSTFVPPTPAARTGYVFTGWKVKTVNP